jgi:hypothetical protein
VKKYGVLLESGNIEDIFADTVYRRKSEMEDFREQIMAELPDDVSLPKAVYQRIL